MKINKQNIGWIFATVLLAGLLALSLYLGFSGWYFKTDISYTTDLQVGKTVQVGINGNEASAMSLNLEGSFLPGEKIPQIISVKNLEDEKSISLRAKASIDDGNGNSSSLNIIETVNWTFNEEDGYYYFNDYLSPQNKVGLCSHIFTQDDILLQSSKKYIITFTFECLEEGQDVLAIWGNNPIQNV